MGTAPLDVGFGLSERLLGRDRELGLLRDFVERASVEGRFFHRGTVAELLPETPTIDFGAQLLAFVRKEFVRPDRSQLPCCARLDWGAENRPKPA